MAARRFVARRGVVMALACVGIFAVALTVRVYDLDRVPPGLFFDEAMNGVDLSKAIDTGDYRWWYPDNNGREGLFINLQSLSVRAFGHEPWALRLVAAVVGAGVVTGIFLLGRVMFPGRLGTLAGAAGAVMAAFGFWHLSQSRVGLRMSMVGLIVVWFLVLLLAALSRYRRSGEGEKWRWGAWWVAAGAAFGLGLHTYPAFRAAGLILLGAVAATYSLIGNRRDWLIGWTAFAIGGLVTAGPMLVTFLQHPEYLRSRWEVAVWDTEDPVLTWLDGVKKTALMFTGPGDCNPRQNYPCRAQLNPVTAGLFVLGVVICLAALFRRGTDSWRRLSSGLLVGGLVAMLTTVTFTADLLPHAQRTFGAAPLAYLLAGLGAAVLGQWLYRLPAPRALRTGAVAGLVAAIVWAAFVDTRLYFDKYPERVDTGPRFSIGLYKQARFLESRPGTRYLVFVPDEPLARADGLSVSAGVSQFLMWDEFRDGRLRYVLTGEVPELQMDKPGVVGVIRTGVPGGPGPVMAELKSRYPDGRIVDGPAGQRYFVR